MPGPGIQSLKARYVFPATAAPIADGAVGIEDGKIVSIGKAVAGVAACDLGNVAILPGLVNAHTHLEFSGLERPIGQPGMGFAAWIGELVESVRRKRKGVGSLLCEAPSGPSRQKTPDPFSFSAAVRSGLDESIRLGTTTLGEIAQPGWPAECFAESALGGVLFQELIAPTPDRVEDARRLAQRHAGASDTPAGWRPGLSPHAPYSVRPELLAAAVALSAEHRAAVAMHLAESREELELLRSGRGPLRDLLTRWEQWDPGLVHPGSRPLDYLRVLARAGRVLVIHGNYLDDEEIAFLAERRDRMSVVYCPRTHAYFGHDPYPLEKMLAAGVTVALGTDSRASSPDLSLLAEMRAVGRRHPDVGRDVVLRMGTLHGARALGCEQEVGSLEPGKSADLAVVELPERNAADPHELLLQSDRPVMQTWRQGKKFFVL